MRCAHVNVGGIRAIVCGSKKIPVCSCCGSLAGLLCDFPQGQKTCDKSLCRGCGINIAPNVDYCPTHPLPASQMVMEFTS